MVMKASSPLVKGDSIGMRIRLARTAWGYSQHDLAAQAGISPYNLCKIERGQHNPSLPTVEKLAKALHMGISELLGEKRIA